MTTIVKRTTKGSPLTHAEVDANFDNLNNDKLELSAGGQLFKGTSAYSGNLGLGVAPSAWGGSFKAIDSVGASTIDASGANGLQIGTNYYNNGTNYIYKASGAAFRISTGSGFQFFTAPSGTVGATITWTQAMTLDASGNLGLGVTPNAWATGGGFFQVPGNGFLGNNTNYSSNAMLFGANAYYDTAWKYRTSDLAASFFQAGNGFFSWNIAPSGTAGDAASFTQVMTLDAGGSLLLKGGGGLGYGTGSGGTVTQTTSKSTAVTLNKPTGRITTHNAALAGGASVAFQLSNTLIGAGDVIVVTPTGAAGSALNYSARAMVEAAGSAYIILKNETAGSLSDAVVLNFVVIKGATS